MKPRIKPPVLKKESKWVLKNLTCSQLATMVSTPLLPDTAPNKQNESLRRRYKSPEQFRKLQLCGHLKAQHHASHVMTAALLLEVPTIELKVAGGRPDPKKMPKYSPSLKRMGAQHGIVIHRWETGAFILAHPKKAEINLSATELKLK